VAYVAEQKFVALGLVAHRDGTPPVLEQRNGLLALKFRAGVVPARAVNAIGGMLRPLFWPPVVLVALVAVAACDVWLETSAAVAAGLRTVIFRPVLGLALFGLTMVSLLFHEFGHAAACRYDGARPGRIGVGIYLVWPAFYTDVTDSYRLSRGARLRTDLGGVYFNALFALSAVGAYFATAYKPLLILVLSQQVLIIDQFIPWMRLDGYHIVSDLIGVPDLFARIKPVLSSLLPRRRPGPRVTELKPWARAAVTTWVLTTVVALAGMAVIVAINAPSYLGRAWQSLFIQLDWIGHGGQIGSVVDVLTGSLGIFMLLLPVVGLTLTYLLLCRGLGRSLAVRRTRVDLTLAIARPETNGLLQQAEASQGVPPSISMAARRAEPALERR
jgi:putative peptide zinc metalloprotease protein